MTINVVLSAIGLLVVHSEKNENLFNRGERSQEMGIPEFNPQKINLSYPREFMEPARKLIDQISTVIGSVMQNTAERLENFFVNQVKPLFRVSWLSVSTN